MLKFNLLSKITELANAQKLIRNYHQSAVEKSAAIEELQRKITTLLEEAMSEKENHLTTMDLVHKESYKALRQKNQLLHEQNERILELESIIQISKVQHMQESPLEPPPNPVFTESGKSPTPIGDEVIEVVKITPKSKETMLSATTKCSECDDAPFGYMVKCWKCKGVFHAGCISHQRRSGEKRTFICSSCEPVEPASEI